MINFTQKAANRVFDLINEAEDLDLCLRVAILGGGCSGFQYSFMFEKNVQAEDIVVSKTVNETQVKLIVDPISLQYLREATIDFKQEPQSEMFVVNNPNAATTCGCGSSFSL